MKDNKGANLFEGQRIEDSIFGRGVVCGTIPLEKGVGNNVLIQWEEGASEKPKSRECSHLTIIDDDVGDAQQSTPNKRQKPRVVDETLLSSGCEEVAAGSKRRRSPRQVEKVIQAKFTTMNFFSRVSNVSNAQKKKILLVSASDNADGHQASGSAAVHGVEVVGASHERERTVKQKANAKVRGRSKAGRSTKETHVSLVARVTQQFPGQCLKVSANKLWCSACATELPNISSSISAHVKSEKHKSNTKKLHTREAAGKQLHNDLGEYFRHHPDEAMSSLRTEVHEFRYKVTRTFLLSGTPLSRLSYFRPLFEHETREGSEALADPSHMASCYIPKIEARESNRLKEELESQVISIAFDGTTRLGEAICITARFCTDDFSVTTRLIRFLTTSSHVDAKHLSALVTKVLCNSYGIDPESVSAFVRDSVMVNGAASNRLTDNPFCSAESVLCISHTLNNCGKHLEFDILNEWMAPWLELVGGRDPHRGAQKLWKSFVAPQVVPGFSNTRWYAKAEIQFVLAENFSQLKPFLTELENRDIGDATRKKMRAILDSEEKSKWLGLQLAAMLDLRQLVRATYELEGDRLEFLLTHDRINRLRELGKSIARGDDGPLPNLDAALRSTIKIKKGVKIRKAWAGMGTYEGVVQAGPFMVDSTLYPGQECPAFKVAYAADGTSEDLEEHEMRPLLSVASLPERQKIISQIEPCFAYLESRITGDGCHSHYSCEHMFRVCSVSRCFIPSFAAQFLTPQWVDDLAVIKPLMSSDSHCSVQLQELKQELPAYLAAAKEAPAIGMDDVDTFSTAVLDFWRQLDNKSLRAWRRAARVVFSISPNSASCERVFSLLDCMFDSSQDGALADLLQSSLMLRYNKRSGEDI